MKLLNTLNLNVGSLGNYACWRNLLAIIGMATIGFASPSIAAVHEDTGPRTITSIGCHSIDNTCFVSLDGPVVGANQGCQAIDNNNIRWDNNDTSEGKRTYSSLLAAFLAGKKVNIHIYGCSLQGYPKVIWYVVYSN